ncbi:MAG: hypothetical protein Q4C95_01725 [Planctomycetia bacterium]|nr:hypothetical protein [Planctomycetia bacterium]
MKRLLMRMILFLFFCFLLGQGSAMTQAVDLSVLPQGASREAEDIPHFPNKMFAFIWRNWNLVEIERLALVLNTESENVEKMAKLMELPDYQKPTWSLSQIYITLLRRNWHILPYEQILTLLDMSPEQLAFNLREDDFLWIKLGSLKPVCQPIQYQEPTQEELDRLSKIVQLLQKEFQGDFSRFNELPRFSFIDDLKTLRVVPVGQKTESEKGDLQSSNSQNADLSPVLNAETAVSNNEQSLNIQSSNNQADDRFELRIIYSYFALFGDPLFDDDAEIFPEGLLQKLSETGVNGVWLHVVLRDLAPGGDAFPEFGQGWEKRLNNLRKLVERAKKYGINVYLYMNEPRAMPDSFFVNHPDCRGTQEGDHFALCSSNPSVRKWIGDALAHLFREVPNLGGIFTITGSENFTHCASHGKPEGCVRCSQRTETDIIVELNQIMEEGVHRSAPNAKVLVWDWGWHGHQIATDIIERLPKNVWLMSVSEWSIPIQRGGINSAIGEYSISAVGPGPRAKTHWETAKKSGLKSVAKVQFNITWEVAAVPYIPVMNLIARHCSNLASSGVDGLMLTWSLGGHPSPNLKIPQIFNENPDAKIEDVLDKLACSIFGQDGAPIARKGWNLLSDIYQEYPFGGGLYTAPTQMGPANLFRMKPTGFPATMVGIPYDDLDAWSGQYPPLIFAEQFEKMSNGFLEGAQILQKAASFASELQKTEAANQVRYAKAVGLIFGSVSNQVRFILLRNEFLNKGTNLERKAEISDQMKTILRNEIEFAKEMYFLTLEDSRIGFEATNHYWFTSLDLIEKVISCQQILDSLE